MKYKAYQIAPEYQESPLEFLHIGKDVWEGITVCGNRDYCDYKTSEFEQVEKYFDELADEWNDRKAYDRRSTLAELLRDYGFERPAGGAWTTKERHAWRALFEDGSGSDDDRIMIAALGLLTGKRYACTTIRGCCQGEWNDVYYPIDEYDSRALDEFEAEYFNTGSEWRIVNADDEDDEVCCYAHDWHEEAIRKELADSVGCAPDEMRMFRFTGWHRTPEYAEIA